MRYHLQEIMLDLPRIEQDRTVNVLSLQEPLQQSPCQLIINRDLLLMEETLDQCVERQIGLIKRQTQAFKLQSREAAKIGTAHIDAILLESRFVQSSKTFHQLQALYSIERPKLIAMTLSSQLAFHDGHRQLWSQLLAGVTPRPTDVAGARQP